MRDAAGIFGGQLDKCAADMEEVTLGADLTAKPAVVGRCGILNRNNPAPAIIRDVADGMVIGDEDARINTVIYWGRLLYKACEGWLGCRIQLCICIEFVGCTRTRRYGKRPSVATTRIEE